MFPSSPPKRHSSVCVVVDVVVTMDVITWHAVLGADASGGSAPAGNCDSLQSCGLLIRLCFLVAWLFPGGSYQLACLALCIVV